MSRWTRASIASSLLALSLIATGCGGRTYGAEEVRDAFGGTPIHFGSSDLRAFGAAPARPVDSFFRGLRGVMSGAAGAPIAIPAPDAVLIANDDVEVLVFATTSRARQAERDFEWTAKHATEFLRQFPDAVELDVVSRRRGNVLTIYPPRLERRVQAALDRLD